MHEQGLAHIIAAFTYRGEAKGGEHLWTCMNNQLLQQANGPRATVFVLLRVPCLLLPQIPSSLLSPTALQLTLDHACIYTSPSTPCNHRCRTMHGLSRCLLRPNNDVNDLRNVLAIQCNEGTGREQAPMLITRESKPQQDTPSIYRGGGEGSANLRD